MKRAIMTLALAGSFALNVGAQTSDPSKNPIEKKAFKCAINYNNEVGDKGLKRFFGGMGGVVAGVATLNPPLLIGSSLVVAGNHLNTFHEGKMSDYMLAANAMENFKPYLNIALFHAQVWDGADIRDTSVRAEVEKKARKQMRSDLKDLRKDLYKIFGEVYSSMGYGKKEDISLEIVAETLNEFNDTGALCAANTKNGQLSRRSVTFYTGQLLASRLSNYGQYQGILSRLEEAANN